MSFIMTDFENNLDEDETGTSLTQIEATESSEKVANALKAREFVELAQVDSVREQIMANFLSRNNFTIEDTPEGKIAIANTTGTRKSVPEFFKDIMDEIIRQNSN